VIIRVAIDARRIRAQHSGLGVYSLELIRALIGRRDLEWIIYAHPEVTDYLDVQGADHLNWVITPHGVDNHLRGDLWKHFELPLDLKRRTVNVFHDLAYQLPLFTLAGNTRRVVTIHDLAPFLFPETNTFRYGVYWRWMTRASVARADRIVAVSNFAAGEIRERFGLDEASVTIIHSAIDPVFRPAPESIERQGRPYIVVVSNFEPRKNLDGLLRAFDRLVHNRNLDIDLLVIGSMGWKNERVYKELSARRLADRVIFAGYVERNQMISAYHSAELAVVPSKYEGFGFPLLEAMACGVPVVSSNASSLPEIGGDAPEYVDPEDDEAMADSIYKVLDGSVMRREMIARGLKRAAEFSWEKTALGYIDCYRSLI